MEGERDRKSPDQNLTLRITGIQQSAYEALQHKCIRKGNRDSERRQIIRETDADAESA